MRKNILLIVLLIFGYFVLAQNLQVPYGRLNAQGDGYDLHNFQTREVISDYGMRASDGTNFHRGIDYVPDGYLEDDAVLSIESGVITSIFEGAGAKRIVIAGDNNGHRFAYLHIFENGFPSTRGQFVMDYLPNTNTPVIIDLVNNRALSTVNNINFNYNGQNYTTTNHVTQNWPIAPIGNSGTMGAHLHLSLLESGNLPSSSTESIDPWNAVVNPDNALETRIRSRSQQNFALNECEANHPAPQPQTQHNWGGIQLDYANDTRNILEVEVAMTGAQTVDNTAAGLDQYTNTCMNEDRIDILIRNTAAGGNSTNIQGRHHHSRFVIDPEGANTTYPERMRDGIYGGTGAIESGCVPFAYRSNGADGFVLQNNDPVHAHDYYVFPDFYLRIHNTQITAPQPNNGLKMANLPWNAKYTDGEYQISSSVRNIEGDQYNLANPININMDNFWPFVRGANVYFNGNQKVYEAYYHANNNTDQCSDVKIFETPELSASNLPQNGPVHIFVETSEPVQTSGSGLISAQIWDPNGVAYAISSLQTDDGGIGQKWKMTFNGPIPYNSGGEYQFRFYHGWDNDNHPMLNFDAWGNTVVEPVPHRTGNNSWAPSAPNANQIGQSRLYKFTLNGTCAPHFANDTPSNNLSPSNDPCECDPVADFSFTPDSDGLTVDFDASTSSGTEPLTYSWTFGGDGDGTGIMPTHIFSEGGTYVVVLTVTNGCGTATATAEHNVTVNEGSPSSMWLTLSGPTLATECQQVSFNANVTGGVPPYTYAWNMGDEYCSPGCPTDCSVNPDFEGDQTESAVFTYTGLGTNSVCVTVTDAVGNSEYECLELKVKNGIQPLEIVINGTPACGSAYASNTLIVMWPDIDPLSAFEYPTDYFWDFGDGDTYFDNFDGGGVAIHSYDSLGDFTITLTVSDPNGSMQATKEISICGPGGGNPPTCDLVNSINPLSPTIVLDYVGNSGAPSSVYFDYTSNQVPLCMPTYKWTGRMDDCGLGYLFNDEDTLLGLPIGSGLNVDLTAENWWGIVTQFRKPWGCLRLQCVESGPYCETCTAPNPSNPCIAYILPDELLISQLAVQEDCPDYQLTAEVEKGAWKLVGSEYTYKEYQWTAFDIDDPSMEIDILVGADAKSPTINTGHPYFDKFTTARYPQFVVKLKVTDFAN
ncbi:MAG: PKD domain-containing protein, partial [Saprospiraceae bacterium]